MANLRVVIGIELEGGGYWTHEHIVTVPPDYRQRDIEPFILHESDKAMSAIQRDNFGYSRSERIIRQFDRRMVLIAALLRRAPHDVRKRPIITRVREIIDMDQDELFARFGDRQSVEG
jgi:hypothetical protein